MSYIQLTSPLVLHDDPVLPDHAVTRRYVDNKKTTLSADRFTSGVLDQSRLPPFTGDITTIGTTDLLALRENGVTSGTYAKITIDSSGRVVGGGVLTAADIPSLEWNKITSGKPNTAAGYGLSNVIPLSGGTSSGPIASAATPSDRLHAVTKRYVDDNITSVVSTSLVAGDVVRKATAITPSGFLRCNGGAVSKIDYAALYTKLTTGANGSVDGRTATLDYQSYATLGNGQPWTQQYDFNTVADPATFGTWATKSDFPVEVTNCQVLVTKKRVYVIGGRVSGTPTTTVYSAVIYDDGLVGAWAAVQPLPSAVADSHLVVTKNRVYLLGGDNSAVVLTAVINNDGTLGTWTTATPLPSKCWKAQVVVTKNRVYLLGGLINGSTSSNVYTAPINADGTIGTWTTGSALPTAIDCAQLAVVRDHVYLIGGTNLSSVYTSAINSDGTLGAWSAGTQLPVTITDAKTIVSKNRIYLLGGSGPFPSTVYSTQVLPTGTLSAWQSQGTMNRSSSPTTLPVQTFGSQIFVVSGNVYLIGGMDGLSESSLVTCSPYLGGLNDYSKFYDGSINTITGSSVTGDVVIEGYASENGLMPGAGRPWEQQYMLAGSQTVNLSGTVNSTGFPVNISCTQPVVTKNKVYLLGGKINGVDSDVVYTCNINSDGTLTAWTDNATYVNATISGTGTMTILGGAKQIAVTAKGSDGYSYGGEMISPGQPYIAPTYKEQLVWDLVDTVGPGTETSDRSTDLSLGEPSYSGQVVGVSSCTGSGTNWTCYSYWYRARGNGNTIMVDPGQPYIAPTYAPGGYVSGTDSTFTVNGTTLTFPADGGTLTKYVTLASATPLTASYKIATGSAKVDYTDYATSTPNGNVLPAKMSNHNAVVTKNRVYLIGGVKEASPVSAVLTAPISATGAIAPWSVAASLPGNANYENSCALITRNRLYVFGGKAVVGGTVTNGVFSAPINADGTIGAWSTEAALPAAMDKCACFTTKNRIYLMAGNETGLTSTKVYTAAVNPDGSIGTWSLSHPLPTHAAYGKVYVTSKAVYVFGANSGSLVYYSPIDSNGVIGAWSTGTSSGYPPFSSAVFAVKNKLHLVGGGTLSNGSKNTAVYTIDNSLSDYSPYYDGTIIPAALSNFHLPDYSALETNYINYYIKY